MGNSVNQIMATKGNQSPMVINQRVTQLGVGQVGVFNANTGLSLSTASSVANTSQFFIAVGVDRDGDTVLDDMIHSAGDYINMASIKHITFRCYSPSQPQIVDITNFVANCNTQYAINFKLQFEAAYTTFGYNLPGKTFAYVTDCCDNCGVGCPSGDCNELAFGLLTAINADNDHLFLANYLDYTTDPSVPVIVADVDYAAWVADVANAGKCLGIRITTISTALSAYLNGINLKYDWPRVPSVIVSLIEGFDCNGTVTVSQNPIFTQGAGYDMLKFESDDAGNNANGKSVYRTSALIGVPFENYVSTILSTGIYAQYVITYAIPSSNGGVQDTTITQLETSIVIPCADTTTRTNFVALMDALTLGKFPALAASNAACPACDVAN